jgi:hypothetical protein
LQIYLFSLFIEKTNLALKKYLRNAKKTYHLPSDEIKIQGALQNDFLKEQFLQSGLKKQKLIAEIKLRFSNRPNNGFFSAFS